MKKCKILPLLGILFLMSSIFVSCKEASDVEPSTTPTGKLRIDLTATLVKDIPLLKINNESRSFTLKPSGSGDTKTAPIQWTSDTWNNANNKPRLVCILKNTKSHSIKCIEIKDDQYQYRIRRNGSLNPIVRIFALIDTPDPNTDELVFYLFDKNQGAEIHSNSGTIDFDGGAMLYNATKDGPVFQKEIDSNTFVEPNKRVYFNFIFSGSIEYSYFLNPQPEFHNFDMYPQGSLLMVDFKSKSGEMNNPGDVCYFHPTLFTNAFDMTGKINLYTGLSTTATKSDITKSKIHFMSYNPDDDSTNRWETDSRKISDTEASPIYVKYVLPRDNADYSINISRNNVPLLKYNEVGSFFEKLNSKRVGLQLEVNSKDVAPDREEPFFYNALSYVGLYNVNKAQDGFNYCNSFDNNALVNYTDAVSMYTNKDFLKNRYHFPADKEFRTIWPYIGRVYFQKIDKLDPDIYNLNYTWKYQIGKAEITNVRSEYRYQEEPIGSGHYVTYALRFIYCKQTKDENGEDVNNDYTNTSGQVSPFLSAWRYEYVDNPNGGGKMLDIYCYAVNVDKYRSTRVDTSGSSLSFDRGDGTGPNYIMSKKFFEDRKGLKEFAHRVFPVPKHYSIGYYWSFNSFIGSGVPVYYFDEEFARGGYDRHSDTNLGCVRPFLNPSN